MSSCIAQNKKIEENVLSYRKMQYTRMRLHDSSTNQTKADYIEFVFRMLTYCWLAHVLIVCVCVCCAETMSLYLGHIAYADVNPP